MQTGKSTRPARAVMALALGLAFASAPAVALEESVVKLCLPAWQAIDPDGDTFSDNTLAEAGLAAARQCEAAGHPLGAATVANMLGRLGREAEALEAVQRALASGQELAAAYQQRCVLEKDEAAAMAACNEASRLAPDWYAPYLTRGFKHFNAQRHIEAEREWRAGLAREPRFAPLRQNLGLALAAQGKHAEALDQHLEARRMAPRFSGPWINVGRTLEALGRQDEALKAFTDASRDIGTADTLLELAAYHERRRQPDQAIAAYGRLLATDPRNVAALRSRARLHEAAQRDEAARDDYLRVAALEPKSLAAALDVVRATSRTDADRAEREAVLEKARLLALEIGTDEAVRQFLQGVARIGRENEAWEPLAEFASKYIEAFPKEVFGFTQRGLARRALGDFQGAIDDETSALALEPKRTHSLFWRADAYGRLGNWVAAEADYSRLLAIDPKYVWAWHNRGRARAELNLAEPSYRDFEQFLALYPGRVTMSWDYWAAAGRTAGIPVDTLLATLNARAPSPPNDTVKAAHSILAGQAVSEMMEKYDDAYYEDCWLYDDC